MAINAWSLELLLIAPFKIHLDSNPVTCQFSETTHQIAKYSSQIVTRMAALTPEKTAGIVTGMCNPLLDISAVVPAAILEK